VAREWLPAGGRLGRALAEIYLEQGKSA
jgi:hypothetical protein